MAAMPPAAPYKAPRVAPRATFSPPAFVDASSPSSIPSRHRFTVARQPLVGSTEAAERAHMPRSAKTVSAGFTEPAPAVTVEVTGDGVVEEAATGDGVGDGVTRTAL